MRVLIAAILCAALVPVLRVTEYLVENIRETLPRDEHDAGTFLAGMTWAFVLFWAILIACSGIWRLVLRW